MRTKIYDTNSPNSVRIYIPFLVNVDEVVVKRNSDGIKIREATIMDKKTYKVNCNGFGIAFEGAKDLIGEYDVEKDGDYFHLVKV